MVDGRVETVAGDLDGSALRTRLLALAEPLPTDDATDLKET